MDIDKINGASIIVKSLFDSGTPKSIIRETILRDFGLSKNIVDGLMLTELKKKFKLSAVNALLLNDKGEILGVSRKYDHNDMGLPGGKIEPFDDSAIDGLKREVFEETGLKIFNIKKVFESHEGKNFVASYTADWVGKIQTDEPHVVRWVKPIEVIKGSFGKYNKELFDFIGLKY